MRNVVEMSNLYKQYGKKEVLTDISLSIRKGEIFGLLGPSGSGKTTIIKHIVGIESQNKGEIRVLNQSLNKSVASNIGYMGQENALYEDLSGYENIRFFASLHGYKGKILKQKIMSIFDFLNLNDAFNKKVSHYSGGMKRRLSLAIALLHEPKLLLLDEPTVGIDPILRKSIWEQLHRLRDQGTSIIVTTHIMNEIEKCDRAALIRNGKIVNQGSIEALKSQTTSNDIEELFLKEGEEK